MQPSRTGTKIAAALKPSLHHQGAATRRAPHSGARFALSFAARPAPGVALAKELIRMGSWRVAGASLHTARARAFAQESGRHGRSDSGNAARVSAGALVPLALAVVL